MKEFDDLVNIISRLRNECPWDKEQTHESLAKHLIEEAYELLDALAAMQTNPENQDMLNEELGDLLLQILLHSKIAEENNYFSIAGVVTNLQDKLIKRHPHVFGDVELESAEDVEKQWEDIKKQESSDSIFDDIDQKLPSITKAFKTQRKAKKLDLTYANYQEALQDLLSEVEELKEAQKQSLQENLLAEPPEVDNEDPLTPLDTNFVTLDQLQEHYRLFVNRVQQQLASFGGGGETKLQYLDDIVGVATNLSAYNGYVLKVDTSLDAPYKFKFAEESGGGNTGYANTAGISTYAVTAGIATYAETAGIATYATSSGIATYAPTAGIATDATNAGYAKTAGISTTSQGLSGTPSITVQDVVGVAATFTGNVTIGGTLTYEDVTNIDVVGLITARSGVDFGSPAVLRLEGASSTKTSSSQASVDSFTAASYRSAQYQVQITRGSIYQMTTINVLHDGTNAYLSEFGTIRTGVNLATFDADINSGSLRLLATPTSSDSTVFKITKTLTVT